MECFLAGHNILRQLVPVFVEVLVKQILHSFIALLVLSDVFLGDPPMNIFVMSLLSVCMT